MAKLRLYSVKGLIGIGLLFCATLPAQQWRLGATMAFSPIPKTKELEGIYSTRDYSISPSHAPWIGVKANYQLHPRYFVETSVTVSRWYYALVTLYSTGPTRSVKTTEPVTAARFRYDELVLNGSIGRILLHDSSSFQPAVVAGVNVGFEKLNRVELTNEEKGYDQQARVSPSLRAIPQLTAGLHFTFHFAHRTDLLTLQADVVYSLATMPRLEYELNTVNGDGILEHYFTAITPKSHWFCCGLTYYWGKKRLQS